jgi:DNA-binding transcriptional ArsR family regulator
MTLVVCPCCRGQGSVELAGEHALTLDALRGLGREIHGAELARLMGTKGPAMNNRLAHLERLGLASSRRSGRKRLYRTKETSHDDS